MTETMTFNTQHDVERLRDAYFRAVERDDETFIWDGYTLVTGYAKYLLQYLDNLSGATQ